jgi:hypothetical protein
MDAPYAVGGCARDQSTTQYCGEAVAAHRRIAELEVAVRRGIACIERLRHMVMWDGIEGDHDDGEVAVTLMLIREAVEKT